MLRVDADAHVLETEETWEFMDGADRKYRPDVVGSLNGAGEIDEYWLVERYYMTGKEFSKRDLLAQNRIWVGCETNDDLPYVIDTAGEDHLVVGTDYGHADSATELLALDGVANDPRLTPELATKITGENARALYSL